TQVSLHRALNNLLGAAVARPGNWRLFSSAPHVLNAREACPTMPQASSAPRGSGDTLGGAVGVESAAGGGVGGEDCKAGYGDIRSHQPVCVLFAIHGGLAGELQVMVLKLLRLALEPVATPTVGGAEGGGGRGKSVASVGGAAAWAGKELEPVLMTSSTVGSSSGAAETSPAGDSAGGERVNSCVLDTASLAKQGTQLGAGARAGSVAAQSMLNDAGVSHGNGQGRSAPPPPAQLLISKGLVVPGTLVELAQELVLFGAGAECRHLAAEVLHHLFNACSAAVQLEVVRRLATQLPISSRQGSRAREWLQFLIHALSTPCLRPALSLSLAATSNTPHPRRADNGMLPDPRAGAGAPAAAGVEGGGWGQDGTLRSLASTASTAIRELARLLMNHPNLGVYEAVGRLVRGAGQHLELEPCVHCYRAGVGLGSGAAAGPAAGKAALPLSATRPTGGGAGAGAGTGTGTGTGTGIVGEGGVAEMESEPVYVNYNLDSIKMATRSTENAMLVQLKSRYSVQKISIRIADAHGRLVRTVNVYHHPKPVASLNDLRVPENASKWHRVASVKVPCDKGTVQVDLPLPLTCANLMIEFADFHADHPRAGSPGTGGGEGGGCGDGRGGFASGALHCPRCGRAVTDMHGVCRQCGEIAFQCRQCRHINYESLDAFLCVECGYCAYGHFSFRVTAAPASGVTPITNEVERTEAIQQMEQCESKVRAARGELKRLRPQVLRAVAALTGPIGGLGSGAVAGCAPGHAEPEPSQDQTVSAMLAQLAEGWATNALRLTEGSASPPPPPHERLYSAVRG
ncbi:unnamed protein product, partial [Discosporangium mesarthrocarpum]